MNQEKNCNKSTIDHLIFSCDITYLNKWLKYLLKKEKFYRSYKIVKKNIFRNLIQGEYTKSYVIASVL